MLYDSDFSTGFARIVNPGLTGLTTLVKRTCGIKHCHPSGSGGVRHRWKSYGLAHFCTSLMSYALCANSSTIRLKLQTCELGRIVDKSRYRGASLNLSVLLSRPCTRLQSLPVRRYCA
nr:MAG TPA: hypothetical protein [Caudoviricetes sp.]